jgi:hypothetical protein
MVLRGPCDGLERQLAERWQQHRADDVLVAGHRRWLVPAIVLDLPPPLGCGIRERCAGPRLRGEGAVSRLMQKLPQPVLGERFVEVAGRRPTALGPRRLRLAGDKRAEPAGGLEPATPSLHVAHLLSRPVEN